MGQSAVGPGSVVASRFRLEDLLDEHSGARFWRATDLTLARNVAIHVISADDPRATAVLTAARTSATVSDGHLLRVLDAVEENGVVHVVHEWGSGVSLDRMLEEEPLEPRRAAWLVREVADAIGVAHAHGVAHGRLLPENVLLTDAGSVKLIGFVVDAVLHGRPRREGDVGDPPEEHEADVLNLGGLLYACLTGKWPGFPASVLPDAPTDHGRYCRPRQVRNGIPKALDQLCDQIVNVDPRTGRRRFESALAVHHALGQFLGDSLSPAAVPVTGPTEPTAFLDASALAPPPDSATRGSLGSYDGEATQASLPRWDDDATRAAPRPSPPPPEPDPARPHGAGMGNGSVPPVWGPDARTDSGTIPQVDPPSPGSRWLRLAAVVGVVVLVMLATAVGFYLGRSDGEDPATPEAEGGGGATPSATPVELAAVSAFDPDGDGPLTDENPEDVGLAHDGDASTSWSTSTYFDGPALAPFKSGVGLLLDLGKETEVTGAALTLVGGPYDVELLAAPEGSGAPGSVDGLETVANATGVAEETGLTAERPLTTRYLVVWLTALPGTQDGFKGSVAEVSVLS